MKKEADAKVGEEVKMHAVVMGMVKGVVVEVVDEVIVEMVVEAAMEVAESDSHAQSTPTPYLLSTPISC